MITTWKDKELLITNTPHICQLGLELGDVELFNAPAVDIMGRDYIVYWEITKAEDGTETFDFNKPLSIARTMRWKA